MKASIVVPAYKPTSLLKGCIDGIKNNTDLTDVEVIVHPSAKVIDLRQTNYRYDNVLIEIQK